MRINQIWLLLALVLGVSGCDDDAAQVAGMGPVIVQERTTIDPMARENDKSSVASANLRRGAFAELENDASPLRRGMAKLVPVRLSEAAAIDAMSGGSMTMPTPEGVPLRLHYERRVEHGPDWSWIGAVDGSPSAKAVITFGAKAVYGQFRLPDGTTFELTTQKGRAFLVDLDRSKLDEAPESPYMLADELASVRAVADRARIGTTSSLKAQGAPAAIASNTVDLVLGYTTGYATFLGGQSQAITRLNHLVDITNQALVDSKVNGAIRLVKTVLVEYPDATSNETALFELTGVSCVGASSGSLRLPNRGVSCQAAARPVALQALALARDQYGADLVSLVRVFNNPENGSCGTAWLLGGAQSVLDVADAAYGFSVVSDSNGVPDNAQTCRAEYLGHEIGHNMGLQHDVAIAQGTDDTNGDLDLLDPEEYGHTPYAFGYNASMEEGDFCTIMALCRSGQSSFAVFANPNINVCGGFSCGDASIADNARELNEVFQVVAEFRQARVPMGGAWLRGDFNGDNSADIVWRNNVTGGNTAWLSAKAYMQQGMASVPNLAWDIAGIGDFDKDGRSDVLWRNSISGQNTIWRSANAATQIAVSALASGWQIAGVGDFNGDGSDDILWRNGISGANAIWRSGNSVMGQYLTSVPDQNWQPAGIGDFNADGKDDILWHNTVNGSNTIWLSAVASTQQSVSSLPSSWTIGAVADFNGDRKADIFWRDMSSGGNIIWLGGNAGIRKYVSTVSLNWSLVAPGDFNGDGIADVLWRNAYTGANTIWLGANAATQQAVTSITNLSWVIGG